MIGFVVQIFNYLKEEDNLFESFGFGQIYKSKSGIFKRLSSRIGRMVNESIFLDKSKNKKYLKWLQSIENNLISVSPSVIISRIR